MGDTPGHEFHGNQWTAGGGAGVGERIRWTDKYGEHEGTAHGASEGKLLVHEPGRSVATEVKPEEITAHRLEPALGSKVTLRSGERGSIAAIASDTHAKVVVAGEVRHVPLTDIAKGRHGETSGSQAAHDRHVHPFSSPKARSETRAARQHELALEERARRAKILGK